MQFNPWPVHKIIDSTHQPLKTYKKIPKNNEVVIVVTKLIREDQVITHNSSSFQIIIEQNNSLTKLLEFSVKIKQN